MTFPWLTTLVALPAVGALLVALVPTGRDRLAKLLAVGVATLVLLLTIGASLQFSVGGPRFQLTERYEWVGAFGFSWAMGVDGVALAMVALTAVATPVVMVAMWHEAEDS